MITYRPTYFAQGICAINFPVHFLNTLILYKIYYSILKIKHLISSFKLENSAMIQMCEFSRPHVLTQERYLSIQKKMADGEKVGSTQLTEEQCPLYHTLQPEQVLHNWSNQNNIRSSSPVIIL
jgi:hypothetical protein